MKKLALASLLSCAFSITPYISQAYKAQESNKVNLEHGKEAFKIERGDCSLTIGAKTKVEHYFDRNIALLNKCLPDEFNYFKNTFDMMFDFKYGKERYGHDAVKAFTKIRHKGVWGRGAVYADSDNSSPSPVKLSESNFGAHTHTSGKPLIWINEAWLEFSINAIADRSDEHLHTVKVGWFPFELGRGISLGAFYGINREGLGLYSYPEDKGAPGILWHGVIQKNKLSYDLYYAKFECHSKSLGDTLNQVKERIIGRKLTPWRGVGKDDDLFAGRLKWKVVENGKIGTVEVEPYALYQAASDQKVRGIADSSVNLGTIGMALEHSTKSGFEFGVEGAFNLGKQTVRDFDRNVIEIKRNDTTGNLVEQYSHILVGGNNAPVTTANKPAGQAVVRDDATPLPVAGLSSKAGRIAPGYTNKFRGYMIVTDIAQKLEQYNLTIAAAYGFASGDENPHKDAKCKTHMGFVGIHELYSGKRVSSLMFLDEMRGVLSIPGAVRADENSVDNNELSFTNLHYLGFGATWKPTVSNKPFTFSPNMMMFWRALPGHKFDAATSTTTTELASRYIGTEFNLKTKMELLKDLDIFGNFGIFIPGKLFTDVKGIPFKNAFGTSDFFDQISEALGQPETDTFKQAYRLGTDVAYHVNVGFVYSF